MHLSAAGIKVPFVAKKRCRRCPRWRKRGERCKRRAGLKTISPGLKNFWGKIFAPPGVLDGE